jgi:hypothetical protein
MKMIPMSVSVGSSYFKRQPPMPTSFTWKRSVIAAAAVPMVLAGCSSPGEPAATTPTASTAAAAEAAAVTPRLVISHDQGLQVSATDLTSGGVVKHLAHMEDHWFTARVGAGELPEPWSSAPFESQPSWDFESAANDSVDEIADLYRTACDRSRSVTDRLPGLDSTAPRPSFGRGPVTLRWVMVHMLEETACHVGHLDLLTDPWSAE